MNKQLELTDDQRARMEATLRRIRCGLNKFIVEPAHEPAHYFAPEVRDAN